MNLVFVEVGKSIKNVVWTKILKNRYFSKNLKLMQKRSRIIDRDENGFSLAQLKELEKAFLEAEDERNLSPIFDKGNDAIKWLKNQS